MPLILNCERCGLLISAPNKLRKYKDHLQNAHGVLGLWPCNKCGGKFNTRHLLSVHTCSENPNPAPLLYCQHSVDTGHADERVKKCSFMGTKSQLARHYKDVHLKRNACLCPHCGKEFSQKSSMDRHLELHCSKVSPKRYACICPHCSKEVSSKSSLDRHLDSYCSKVAPKMTKKESGRWSHGLPAQDQQSEEPPPLHVLPEVELKKTVCHNPPPVIIRQGSCSKAALKTFLAKKDRSQDLQPEVFESCELRQEVIEGVAEVQSEVKVEVEVKEEVIESAVMLEAEPDIMTEVEPVAKRPSPLPLQLLPDLPLLPNLPLFAERSPVPPQGCMEVREKCLEHQIQSLLHHANTDPTTALHILDNIRVTLEKRLRTQQASETVVPQCAVLPEAIVHSGQSVSEHIAVTTSQDLANCYLLPVYTLNQLP